MQRVTVLNTSKKVNNQSRETEPAHIMVNAVSAMAYQRTAQMSVSSQWILLIIFMRYLQYIRFKIVGAISGVASKQNYKLNHFPSCEVFRI